METIITLVVAALAALGFVWIKDKQAKKDIEVRTEVAQRTQDDSVHVAQEKYDERIAKAQADIEADLADRPVTDDPLADLSDRLRRNAARIRRRRTRRNGTGS